MLVLKPSRWLLAQHREFFLSDKHCDKAKMSLPQIVQSVIKGAAQVHRTQRQRQPVKAATVSDEVAAAEVRFNQVGN